MSIQDDIAGIAEQERLLVFKSFDSNDALALGLGIKKLIEGQSRAVAIDIRLWDRQLFGHLMNGMRHDHEEWMRRKSNGIRRFHKSSYRMMLERGGEDKLKPHVGLDFDDYVFAGGGFPLQIEGIGCVGSATVSGLKGREDHALIAEAICEAVGVDYAKLALPIDPTEDWA